MMLRYSLIALLSLSLACVPTDETPDDDFKPFVPDMASGDLAEDLPTGADMTGVDMLAPEMGGPADMSGVDMPGADMPDMSDNTCQPNLDGVIERREVPIRAGLFTTFRVATDAAVNTAGELQPDGSRVWDLSGDLPGDRRLLVEAQDPNGRWFSNDFLDADYVAKLSESSELLGVFQITDNSLLLQGVVSPQSSATSTKLTYSPAVTTLAFPLQLDASWSTNATVRGTLTGNPFATYSEAYTSRVDAQGRLKTPFGEFSVVRVRTDLTRTVGLLTTRVRTYIFVTECFGTIATITSRDNESEVEFTTAAEVRRLAP